jgi:hypothetical protein
LIAFFYKVLILINHIRWITILLQGKKLKQLQYSTNLSLPKMFDWMEQKPGVVEGGGETVELARGQNGQHVSVHAGHSMLPGLASEFLGYDWWYGCVADVMMVGQTP